MNPVDPRWLEILKASSWQLAAVSLALGVFWYLLQSGVLPPVEAPLIVYGLPLAILVTGSLALVGMAESGVKWCRVALGRRADRKASEAAIADEQQALREYIPFMDADEKAILGYLLHMRQKTFRAAVDGDKASTLLGRGIVRMAVQPAQIVLQSHVPFTVPDHLWSVLEERASDFPEPDKDVRRFPWVSSWA